MYCDIHAGPAQSRISISAEHFEMEARGIASVRRKLTRGIQKNGTTDKMQMVV